jgi:uncharacterized membrane protein
VRVDPSDTTSERPAFWHDGVVTVIGPLDGGSVTDLNDLRQIAGCGRAVGSAATAPFIWENNVLRWLPNLSTLVPSCALDINNKGVAVGHSNNRPVIWQGTTITSLNPPNTTGMASRINERGEIVGLIANRHFYRPAIGGGLWDLATLMDFTPDPPPDIVRAVDINNKGEILVDYTRFVGGIGVRHIVLAAPVLPAGADQQPPTVAITSPTTGSYVTDLATLQATASDDVGVVGVQFFVNGAALGAEDVNPPYAADLDLVGYSAGTVLTFWARARDAAGNTAVTNIKSLVVQNSCQTVTRGQSSNNWLGNQTGTFTARWTGTPGLVAPQFLTESGFALSLGRQSGFAGTSAAVLFAPDGEIKVRNGAAYPASGVRYGPGNYRFRMVVNVPANTYSVWYRLPNQPEQPLATNFQFRGNPVTALDNWMIRVDETSPGPDLRVCNVRVQPGS